MGRICFAGIGNRWLTDVGKENLTKYAWIVKELGLKCRSGGAKGSDKIFEEVFREDCKVIKHTEATDASRAIAAEYHPNWAACDPLARDLLGRNAQIILGENLDHKAAFVLCAASSEMQGGTSLGIKIARGHDIPVFNVYNKEHKFDEFLETLKKDNQDE